MTDAPTPPSHREVQAENAELIDRLINRELKKLEDNPDAEMSPALLSAITRRLQSTKVSALPVPGSAAGDLMERVRARPELRGVIATIGTKGAMPPLDTENKDAATG